MAKSLYLYCIAGSNQEINFGNIGIDGCEVYVIPFEDLCAVVHECSSEPYKSEDNEEVKKWVMAHHRVVNIALEIFGNILPLGFDTIIKGEEGIKPEENMINWIKHDYGNLKQKLAKVKDKAEYGIQVLWYPKLIGKKLIETNQEIKKHNEEIKSRPRGSAYMYKQKLENLLKKEMELKAESYFKNFYQLIKRCVDNIKVEKTKKLEEEKHMLMNLSCLLPREKCKILGEELEKINNMEGFSVHFTGPWPPYSFV